MTPTFRADCLSAEGAVFDTGDHLMVAVTVIEWAHDLEVGFLADWARLLINNRVAGVALIPPFLFWDCIQCFEFFNQCFLFRIPLHYCITPYTFVTVKIE